MKKSCAIDIDTIKSGYIESNETVYGMINREERAMYVYDSEGIFLYQRQLTPEERATPTLDFVTNRKAVNQ